MAANSATIEATAADWLARCDGGHWSAQDAAALLALLEKENAGAAVIGLPVNMDGSEGPSAQRSRAFVRNMKPLSALPFVLWDERLSTVAAERTLIEMDFSRKKRAGKIDSAAAAFILQGALDRLRALAATSAPPSAPEAS